MKKYRVTFKRSGKVWGEYASKEEASEKAYVVYHML